jgi:hypothetical protein
LDITRLPFLSGSLARDADKPRIAHEGQQAVDLLHGRHFVDCLRGRVFSQSATPLGLAIPIYTATAIAGAMPLWNPPGSGVVVELLRVDICYGSGTAAFSSLGLMAGQLSSIGTASGCSAFAATVPVNGYLLGGNGSRCISSNAGAVTVTAGTATAPVAGIPGAGWVRSVADINLEAQTGTAHGSGLHTYDFDGTVIVPPGVLVYFAATLASVALYATCVQWKEIPIVQ